MREFWNSRDMANSSLCSQWHIFLWAEATVAMPEEWFCLESCHILRFLVIFLRRINCWVTKPWTYLGLSGCRCWINHGSKKWTVSNRVTCISKHGPGSGSWSETSLAYIVWSDGQQSCQISASVLPDSQWKAIAHTVHMRGSGRISLWEINNFSFTLPNPQRQWLQRVCSLAD